MVVAQEKFEFEQPIFTDQRHPKRPVHRPKKKGKAKGIFALFLIAGMMAAVGVATVQVTVVKNDQVKALEKEIGEIKQQNDLLQVEVDKLRSVSRIEKEALAMGMEKPSGTVYVAGTFSSVQNETGSTQLQVADQSQDQLQSEKPSAFQQIARLFTDFFALIQR